ncbi:LexA family transcriptional regulator [Streptomyces sp. AC602_WCS936]|uniref:LexA family protein n=1 Tax=Streptomyces sp. AC602_WCS936 TaxID=2823685 RepID=UPI001C273CD4|nr:hypothetical protein [Streptomyces sp. AC602_WCS936]
MVRSKHDYLTANQQQLLRGIRQWIAEHGEAPTVKELTECGPLNSQSSVHYQLRELEAKGAIVRERYTARGIRLR